MYYKIEKIVDNYPFQAGSYSIILLFSTNVCYMGDYGFFSEPCKKLFGHKNY